MTAARQAGASGTVIVRADSQFYNADVAAACRRSGAHFSLTVRMNPHVAAAISAIPEHAWTAIRYPDAFVDPDTGDVDVVSDAEVAEIQYTAFTGRKQAEQVTARLIVRRIRRLNAQAAAGQGELFTAWRYHPVFTDSPFAMLQAELHHRQHATIEQVIADGKSGPLAHLPSGNFQANAAWLTLWAIAFNLLRAAGALAGSCHAKATTATLRAHLINIPARIARTARHLTLHLPERWHGQDAFTAHFDAAHAPPAR
ncbi:transposase [Streptomyces sp. NPDC102274]|uniref:transposase n=1 Tax=Streptomyces sp. NPDC102274 TaxID=3366151 RepID=UPI003826F18D